MRYLLLALLAGCLLVVAPGDLLGPGTYCQPIHDNVWRCRDGRGAPYTCTFQGAWHCRHIGPRRRW